MLKRGWKGKGVGVDEWMKENYEEVSGRKSRRSICAMVRERQ